MRATTGASVPAVSRPSQSPTPGTRAWSSQSRPQARPARCATPARSVRAPGPKPIPRLSSGGGGGSNDLCDFGQERRAWRGRGPRSAAPLRGDKVELTVQADTGYVLDTPGPSHGDSGATNFKLTESGTACIPLPCRAPRSRSKPSLQSGLRLLRSLQMWQRATGSTMRCSMLRENDMMQGVGGSRL